MATFGYNPASTPASISTLTSGEKWASKYTLSVAGSVSKLSLYASNSHASAQVLKAVLYADSAGSPTTRLGIGTEVTIAAGAGAAFVDLPFASNIVLSAADYWLGWIGGTVDAQINYGWDTLTNGADFNSNSYAGGATDPFGAFTQNNKQLAVYATLVGGAINLALLGVG